MTATADSLTPGARPAHGPAAALPVSSPASVTVFTALLTHDTIARVEVARRLGLSAAAVTKAVQPLLEAGYVVDVPDERPTPTVGRPASPLRVVADRRFFVGVKVTATELIGVLADLRARIRASRRVPLVSGEPSAVAAATGDLVDGLLDAGEGWRDRVAAVGVSVSGDVDSGTGRVRHSPLLGWRDVPLGAAVQQRLGLPVVVENDVRALTLAERWFGEGHGAASFAMVTIGAGVGCGLFVNDDVVAGAHGVSGEIGHLPLVDDGPVCTCGRWGCVETVASSAAILRDARLAADRPDLTMKEAVERAHAGDAQVRQVFDRAGDVIGTALAAMVNLVGPERVVISGEGVADYDLYGPRIRAAFAQHAFGAAADCELIVRGHSFDDWARGASVAAIRAFVRSAT